MGDRLADMGGAEVVLVTFTRARNLRGYRARLGLTYTVVADETCSTYRAYGLPRAPWWRLVGPATVREYVRLLRAGKRLSAPKEDVRQLGGDFVVDGRGTILLAYRSRGPADRPPVDEIVAAVARARVAPPG